jgi:glycosyltransferase involved in cell wall biosynthesis
MISVIIMTHDSAQFIERTLRAAFRISDDVHVIDSFSEDDTVDVCRRLGCQVVQRRFRSYAEQRNWAFDNLTLRYGWHMHLDADEELEDHLISLINGLEWDSVPYNGYIVGRKIVFMGRVLRHGGISTTWHCRIFRNGFGRCEDRLYDNHFVCSGPVKVLRGFLLDHQVNTISEWTARHNYWSDYEAQEVTSDLPAPTRQYSVAPNAWGNPIERKRYIKTKYYSLPLFSRVFAYFFYRYLLRLGFLDGVEGMIFHILQGFWLRFLIDAKIFEARRRNNTAVLQGPAALGMGNHSIAATAPRSTGDEST